MEGHKQITWNEFYSAPGVLEAMTEVYNKTGCTVMLLLDEDGKATMAKPIRKVE